MNDNTKKVTLYEMLLNQELARIDVRPVQCEDHGDAFVITEGKFFDMYKVVEKEHLGEVFRSNDRYCMITETDDRRLFAEKCTYIIEKEARNIEENIVRPHSKAMFSIRIAEARANRFKGDVDAGVDAWSIQHTDATVQELLQEEEIERRVILREGEIEGVLRGRADRAIQTCEFWFFPYEPDGGVAVEALRYWTFHVPGTREDESEEYHDFLVSFIRLPRGIWSSYD